MPISGWAAFIAATHDGDPERNGVTEFTGYEAFLSSIPTNYYAITAILFVFAVAYFGLNFGPMRKHEEARGRGRGPGGYLPRARPG